ncbi:VWA domain-containing protein [Candidatus Falkowbacteria bacterium]|jgi:hypothetical protein|nr:VWA domain-containing protein [Candidatus Falkowbacteria bacterium]MBT5502621.1 VWA domain-containing protein [Candidatus Falkowbacteria bacterium]MBT6574440.1 VWA domain-containing protein [Candidatus Falkowbacteria bacterium]MBT7348950.1 VWA domain-containing protein [Candidatus Falkowbacteria bacterium]MBT7500323.1 VWA domain-containing protein [Candidatus Falkowbacteria bacterium]
MKDNGNKNSVSALIPGDALNGLVQVDTKPKTLSIMILDQSSSMMHYDDTPQTCINGVIEECKNPKDGRTQFCTVIAFDDEAEILLPLTLATEVVPISNYRAKNMTLLWETVYQTLKVFRHFYRQANGLADIKVYVAVFSDGDDNKSDRERQPRKVKKLARSVRALGWELFCYGIGIDGERLAEDMGFPTDSDHAITVEGSPEAIANVTRHYSDATTTGCFDPNFFKKKQKTTTPQKP